MGGFLCGVLFLLAGLGGPLVLELLCCTLPAEIFIPFNLAYFTLRGTRRVFKIHKHGLVTCFLVCTE